MNKFGLISLLILIAFCTNIFCKIPDKISLIVKHCLENETVCSHQKIIRLNFENGEFAGKELIMETETDKVRFDLGKNRIYKNRFLISNWGDVVDLKEKKILHQSEGTFFKREGDKIFIQVNRIDKDGLYVFDLKTRQYNLFKKTDDPMFFGKLSPNGIRSADWTCPIDNGCGIEIKSFGKEENFIKGDFSVEVDKDLSSSEMLDVPVFWLDDERILTQLKNGELVVVHINGQISPLMKIKLTKEPNYNPEIYRGTDGKIYYRCADTFLIDVENKTYKKITNDLGNGFTYEEGEAFWTTFYFNGEKIGNIWSSDVITTKGYLALHYAEPGKNLGYPDGIMVWNVIKKDWKKIKIKWSVNILGWLED